MYVETTRDELQALKLPGMNSAAEFSANNKAQVSADDGAVLIDEVDHITEA